MTHPASATSARPAPALAATLMLCATAFIAATTLLAKALGTDALGPALHPFQVTHGRFLFAWIAIVTTVAALRPRLIRPAIPLHIARTVCGFVGVTCMFAAAAAIPLATATAISFLNPVFGMLLAIPLLGERVGKWRWLAAGIALTHPEGYRWTANETHATGNKTAPSDLHPARHRRTIGLQILGLVPHIQRLKHRAPARHEHTARPRAAHMSPLRARPKRKAQICPGPMSGSKP